MAKRYLLEGFAPQRVLRHFEDICAIPHGSGNEKALGDHILALADRRGLSSHRDAAGNILIRVPATQGCEEVPSLLLQGHLDMVCVKEDGVALDMEKEPVRLVLEEGILRADGTSLGADNAVGLCVMMALMEADDVCHPPLELLLTVQEEVGLVGIRQFDARLLQSRRMINMDCGDPDCMVIGAAGGGSFAVERRCDSGPAQGIGYDISITGLRGGHSGLEIGKNRASALDLAGRLLSRLCGELPIRLAALETPGPGSSIPQRVSLRICVPEAGREQAASMLARMDRQFAAEVAAVEREYAMTVRPCAAECAATEADTRALASFLLLVPFGVSRRSERNPAWVLCSALLSQASYEDGSFRGKFAIRANRDADWAASTQRMEALCRLTGVDLTPLGAFTPAWPEAARSALREVCLRTYEDCFGQPMTVEVEHGIVEVGVLSHAIPEMDIVGFAPKSRGAHTTREHLYVDTVAPFWDFLVKVLSRLCA